MTSRNPWMMAALLVGCGSSGSDAASAIGWDAHGHKFGDLVGSDHAEIHLKDPMGATVFHFSTDYLTATDDLPSGYSSLGIWGGEGQMIEGDETQVLAANSSISRNLND